MNLYDTVIRRYPVIFLTEIQDNCMPCYEQARKFSEEIAEHIDILEDGKLMELAKYLDWEVFLKRIPSTELSRLLILPDVPWSLVSDKDYVPIEVLREAMDHICKETFGTTYQSLDVLKEYRKFMNWKFISKNYSLDHPAFRDGLCRNNLRWLFVSSREDLTESFVDEMINTFDCFDWGYLSMNFLSRNQDLISKYVKHVDWGCLSDLTIETIRKWSSRLHLHDVLGNRDTYLKAKDAEIILSIKDLKRSQAISVKRILLDRDFIKRHRKEINFYTLRENKYVTKRLLTECIEFVPWEILQSYWKDDGMLGERRVSLTSCFYYRNLFPFSVFRSRDAMEPPIDWEAMEERIDNSSVDVTVNEIYKYVNEYKVVCYLPL